MAITTRAQFSLHIFTALRATLTAEPLALRALLPGLMAYAATGADPREAVEMFLTWAWPLVRPGQPFQGHRWKHLCADAGVPAGALADITERIEP